MPLLEVVNDDSDEEVTSGDPILDAPVYFGREPTGAKGKEISELISSVNQQRRLRCYSLSCDPWLFVNRPITREAFAVLLRYYENNQYYYLEQEELEPLLDLQIWFIQVIEPPPKTDDSLEQQEWLQREADKIQGYSHYCDPQVKLLVKLPDYVMAQVKLNHSYFTSPVFVKRLKACT